MNNNVGISIYGGNLNNITGNDIVDNKVAISLSSIIENVTNNNINYNRFFNNIANFDNSGNISNNVANLNWWVSNTPNTNVTGVNIANWFVMKIKTNINKVTVGDNLPVEYAFTLNNDSISYNPLLLPYFITEITTNDGFLEAIDARISKTVNIAINTIGNITITFNTDNEAQTLQISSENNTPIPPIPVPPEPVKTNAKMKNTGIPLFLILLSLVATIGIFIKRKNNNFINFF